MKNNNINKLPPNDQQKLNLFTVSDVYTACGIIEGFVDIPNHVDKDNATLQAWQYLIDSGHAWTLQGWYGRNAKALIVQGICTPPNKNT